MLAFSFSSNLSFLRLSWFLSIITTAAFQATTDLQEVLSIEDKVADLIDQYIRSERAKLRNLQQATLQYRKATGLKQNNESVLSGPARAYLSMKQITNGWQEIKAILSAQPDIGKETLMDISKVRRSSYTKFPGNKESHEAVMALLRLQDVYALNTSDLASNRISELSGGGEMTAFDCFQIGNVAHGEEDYYHSWLWIEEAIRRYDSAMPNSNATLVEMMEYLAFAMFSQNATSLALGVTKEILKLEPTHARALVNVRFYQQKLEAAEAISEDEYAARTKTINERREISFNASGFTIGYFDYEALCRNEVGLTPAQEKDLHCYYKMDRPFIRIAPIKTEVVHRRPLAIVFRNVISDREIDIVKNLTAHKLYWAGVFHKIARVNIFQKTRISKSAWLHNGDHPITKVFADRLEDMTGLNLTASEGLQMAYYNIGGHYDPHHDYAYESNMNAFKELGMGNRIATVLFYLHEPYSGGATVFPLLRLAVFPSKHDALFWYNMKQNGEPDPITLHAACPVLAGIKWAANKWIHIGGQEFRRPCSLNEDDYE